MGTGRPPGPNPAAGLDPGRRRPGGRAAGVLLLICALPFFGLVGLRALGLDGSRYTAAIIALTPYGIPVGVVLGLLALLLRRWVLGAAVLGLTILLVAMVAPRVFADSRPNGSGTTVRVLSVNLRLGLGDAPTVVDLVRRYRPDVLSLQELTPDAVTELDRAGLAAELPYRVFQAARGAPGSGLAARHPLRELALAKPATNAHPSALVDLPGSVDLEVVAVHPHYPVGPDGTDRWLRDMAGLPEPKSSGPVRVLAGDFNATLDHSPLRRLIGQGYSDAADQVGAGLVPTWPGPGQWIPPPVSIDHVLVDRRCPVESFSTFEVPGTDHRAVLAVFGLPENAG